MKTAFQAALLLLSPFLDIALCQENSPVDPVSPLLKAKQGIDTGTIKLQFPETPIQTVVILYETLTNRKIITDPSAAGINISIQSSSSMSNREAAEFIEHSLLQNGFAFVPTQRPDHWKLVPATDGTTINGEFIPIIQNPLEIPLNEDVVTYIATLKYLPSVEAASVLGEIVSLHPYGRIVAIPSSNTIIITESGSMVRRILNLLLQIDTRSEPEMEKLFSLERATAEDVTNTLVNIYSKQSGSSPTEAGSAAGQTRADRTDPGEVRVAGQTGISVPSFQGIAHSNSVLVVTTADEMLNVERMIGYLDAPGPRNEFIKMQLNYLTASNFLKIAGDSLTRGLIEQNDQVNEEIGQDVSRGRGNFSSQNSNRSNNGSGFDGNPSASSSADLSTLNEEIVGPQSIVIGKTLLIADNDHNVLIASGPPEELFLIEELVEAMDTRPEQIQISAVIAQMNLGNDYSFGIDFLRTLPANAGSPDAGGVFRSRSADAGALLDIQTLTDAATLAGAATNGLNVFAKINSNLSGFVSTLETTNRFKILSRPTVYTLNNRRAIIQTGQRVAVPRSTLSSIDPGFGNNNNQVVTANIDYENVLLKIEVIPLINNDGQITLRINQSNDDIVGNQIIGGESVPTIGTQALGTTIMVPDGQTVLLGGLISEEDTRDESGLPLFANFPLVGRVAGSRGDKTSRQELLIFIQPRVIRSDIQYKDTDENLIDRTRIGEDSVNFSEGEVDNRPVFESEDFNSPEKRTINIKNFFRKLTGKTSESFDRP